jgi:membrane protein
MPAAVPFSALPRLARRAGSEWVADKASRLAASLALYTMMSLAPLLVITVRVLAVALGDKAASGEVEARATEFLGPKAADLVAEMIGVARDAKGGALATVISVAVLLFGASGFFIALQDAMNTIWHVQAKPPSARRFGFLWDIAHARLRSAAMVLCVALLVLAAAVISTVLSALTSRLPPSVRGVTWTIDLLLSLSLFTAAFAAVLRLLPDVKLAWKDVWLGAAVTAALFTLGKYALTLYFRYGVTTSAYGAAGSLAAVLIWVYYSAQIFFFGAEFTKVYAERYGPGIVPEPHAVHLTEAELAAQGIPSEETIEKAVDEAEEKEAEAAAVEPAGALSSLRGEMGASVPATAKRRTAKDYMLGAGGLMLGAIAGGLGVFYYLAGGTRRPARRR